MSNDRPINKLSEDKFGLEESAQRFSEEYITSEFNGSVLLSGKWGSGKSSYLNLVKGASKKGIAWFKQINFVNINFWENGWESKPYEIIFKGISRRCWFITRTLPLFLVLFSAMFLFLLDLFKTGGETVNQLELQTWLGISVVAAVINFTLEKFSFEPLFEFLTNLHLKRVFLRKKVVFICDDFDRVEEHVRKVVYPILMKVTNYSKVTLVIVGEYEKIAKNTEESVLIQKIIGHVELAPIEINSEKVWDYLEASMENKITDIDKITDYDKKLITSIKELFIYEKRTMREAKLLLNLMDRRYFKEFQDKVNLGEQFSMCYLYSFHHEVYQWLTENQSVIYHSHQHINIAEDAPKYQLRKHLLEKFKDTNNTNMAEVIHQLFDDYDNVTNYPSLTKADNFEIYCINNYNLELVFTVNHLEDILRNETNQVEAIKTLIINKQFPTFSHQLRVHYMTNNTKGDLAIFVRLITSICIIIVDVDFKDTSGLLSVSEEKSLQYSLIRYIYEQFSFSQERLFSEAILDKDALDLSQKLSLLPNFVPARDEASKQTQFKVVEKLFKMSVHHNVTEFKIPFMYLMFYKRHRKAFESQYDNEINEILLLEDGEFFTFTKNKLSSPVRSSDRGTYHVIHIEPISYNESFEKKFLERIDKLPSDEKAELTKMIKEGTY